MTGLSYELAVHEMSDGEPGDGSSLLNAQATVPQHVVYRDFANETVVLNLQTGRYHGLNPTAGLMLQAIDRADSVGNALDKLVADYGWNIDEVAPDFVDLCEKLTEFGLLELDRSASS